MKALSPSRPGLYFTHLSPLPRPVGTQLTLKKIFVACGLERHALNGRQKSLGLGEAMSPCHAGPAGGLGKGRRPTGLKMTRGSDEVGEACLSRFEPCPP